MNSINVGASVTEIVEELKVGYTTVYEYRRNINSFGVHNPPPTNTPHRPRIIHLATEEAIIDLLVANLEIYLDEIQDWLALE